MLPWQAGQGAEDDESGWMERDFNGSHLSLGYAIQQTVSFADIRVGPVFFRGFIFASWASRIPVFKNQFHFNEAELVTVLFMLPLGSFIALPFAGWPVDRFGSCIMGAISTSACPGDLTWHPDQGAGQKGSLISIQLRICWEVDHDLVLAAEMP
jgi:hypothetical protein